MKKEGKKPKKSVKTAETFRPGGQEFVPVCFSRCAASQECAHFGAAEFLVFRTATH